MQSESFQDSLKMFSKGAAIKNVASVKILKQIKISFPLLSEQHRIVKIIEEAFEKIEKTKENAEKNLKNSKSFLSLICRVFLRIRERIGEKKTLGEVCDFIMGKHTRKLSMQTELILW